MAKKTVKKDLESTPAAKTASAPAEFPGAKPTGKRIDLYYEGWLTLRTPLMHGDGETLGNIRLFRSQKMVCADGRVRSIPVYSGNAFRGMLRDIAAQQLMQALDVSLPTPVFHFLTSGGSLSSGGNTIDIDQARSLRHKIPMVGIFGGGVGNQILEGKLKILQLTPICKETTHLLPEYCQQAPSATLSIRDLRHMEFGTRRDDSKRESNQCYLADAASKERNPDEVSTSMIYESEMLAPGTCLRFGFTLDGVSQREWMTFCHALIGWLKSPFLGGRSSAGYGEVAVPSLYRAKRQLVFHQGASSLVDIKAPLATVDNQVDQADRLDLLPHEISHSYDQDVEQHRQELFDALRSVV